MPLDGDGPSGLRGRLLVVTGGSSGIGAAAAALLTARGAQVITLDIRPPAAAGPRYVPCDLADPGSISRAVATLPAAVDGLVSAAGLPGTHDDERVFRVNFLGLRELTESLLPRLPAGGSVVHVASTAGSQWARRLPELRRLLAAATFADGLTWFRTGSCAAVPAYNLAKEAVCVYTMASARAAARAGVAINAVSPGPVQTPILPDCIAAMGADRIAWARDLAGRYGQPADIAPVIAFLLSPAAGWIRGANVIADGGVSAAVLSGSAVPPQAAAAPVVR
jgi:NAD(P)-dependent dehydrogenase (short-subunit alcohol dehydrogenase family)